LSDLLASDCEPGRLKNPWCSYCTLLEGFRNPMSPSSLPLLPINRLDSTESDFAKRFTSLLAWEDEKDQAVEQVVSEIIQAVRREGDAAVLRYTERFDRLHAQRLADLEIPLSVCQ